MASGYGTGRVLRRTTRHGSKTKTWFISYCDGHGRRIRESSKTDSYDDALQLLRKRMGALADGTHRPKDRRRLTVADALQLLVDDYELEQRASIGSVRAAVTHWTREFGDHRCSDVTTADVKRVIRGWRTAGRTPSTTNRYVQALRRSFKLAKIMIDPNVLDWSAVLLSEATAQRGKYIPKADIEKIAAALPAYLVDAFLFTTITGIRRRQLLSTTWNDVDRSTWTITWPAEHVKQRRMHSLALAGAAREILERRWAERNGDYVFHHRGRQIVDITKTFRQAVTKAGLVYGRRAKGYTWHGLRNTSITNMSAAGISPHAGMGVSGHSTLSSYTRYNVTVAASQRSVLEAVAGSITPPP